MERWTNHFEYCDFIDCKYKNAELAKENQCNFFNMTSMDRCLDKHIYEKLREYEDLEEQGLLVKLPCKVGDTIYYILGIPNKTPCVIESCEFELSDIEKIGKTLFLTKEEAEKALAEMG